MTYEKFRIIIQKSCEFQQNPMKIAEIVRIFKNMRSRTQKDQDWVNQWRICPRLAQIAPSWESEDCELKVIIL
jgi:hypothetical protein